jgi:peptidoglycan/xylan/chitin deacetylase (PgdA/CDA1 family)
VTPYGGARGALKSLLAGGLYYTGALEGFRRARLSLGHPQVHIFGFHRVVPDFEAAAACAIPALCVSVATFRAQLDYLARTMEVLDLASAVAALAGARPLRRDACVLTFDDGYRDTYTRALPILRQLGLPAVLFVASDFVDTDLLLPHDRLYATLCAAARRSPRPAAPEAERFASLARAAGPALATERLAHALPASTQQAVLEALLRAYGPGEPPDDDGHIVTWDMCRQLGAAGVEIGTHTASHAPLAHETLPDVARELARSRFEIERHLGRPVRFVAYPNGAYSSAVARLCAQMGFRAALTTDPHPNRLAADPMRLGRKLLWEAHGRGPGGRPSPSLVASHLENLHGGLGWPRPVPLELVQEEP